MSRIEMVMHLQSLDLFKSCAAAEAIRLAQIAKPVQLVEGDVVYRPAEPAEMLYSVVEGRVLVEDNDGACREVGPRNAFGVLEVLSGRQRSSLAKALTGTLVLAIAEEDFFDLLSNNIDIVKALFREVLDEPIGGPGKSQSFADKCVGAESLSTDLPAVAEDGVQVVPGLGGQAAPEGV